MADSINDIAIKLNIDAEGVRAGFKRASDYVFAFRKDLEKAQEAQNRVRIIETQQHDAHIEQKRQKDAEYSASYMKQIEKELQAYYQAEERKSQILQEAEQNRRQEMMNRVNAGRLGDNTPFAETAGRQADLERLRQDIIDRYTLLQQEENRAALNANNMVEIARLRAAREAAARSSAEAQREQDFADLKSFYRTEEQASENNARNRAEIERLRNRNSANANAEAERLREQDYANLKAHYARLEREGREQAEVDEQMRRRRVQNFMYSNAYGNPYDNPEDRAARRAAQAGRMERDNQVQQRNNQLQAEAAALIARTTTLQERYAAELARITLIRSSYNIQTGRALLTDQQAARAVTDLTLRTIRLQQAQVRHTNIVQQNADITRIMVGVMSQGSFAAEDFIQGLVFGDVRNALLGAANNLTMVVRGLNQAAQQAGGMAEALWGIVRPVGILAAGGAAMLAAFNWARYASRDVRSLSETLDDAKIALGKFRIEAELQRDQRQFDLRLSDIDTAAGAHREVLRIQNEILNKEREIQDLKREQAVETQGLMESQLGGVDALIELEQQLNRTIANGTAEEVAAANRIRNLLGNARDAAGRGESEKFINSLREVYEILNNQELDDAFDWIGDLTALDALEETFQTSMFFVGESAEKLRELRKEILANGEEMSKADKERLQMLNQIIALKEKEAELLRIEEMRRVMLQQQQDRDEEARVGVAHEIANARREEMLFMLRATDAQKRLLDIQREQEQLMGGGLGANGLFGIGGFMDFMAGNMMNQEFLQGQAALLEEERKKILGQNAPTAQGGLASNAFEAQAEAFKQINEAASRKPDPQLRAIEDVLKVIRDALRNGGVLKIVQ